MVPQAEHKDFHRHVHCAMRSSNRFGCSSQTLHARFSDQLLLHRPIIHKATVSASSDSV
ncbi:uncharacterized protein SETTUDRAFT_169307 [Exserohilum turcica Et28A]|uniref:Uncharacterized protein n=1 Tax=Exserohilum turcicum (strain 28A) TaxID=671987 RepID=R0JZ91_EXST2|nr:uncharacterized protein SETTUDRAFT_169307 [Exserohilum turcica Et28A]EOA86193.1 hypothetical protein SETTUDRAFT_169307 [Exserohilum turcica Et28A]